METTTVTKSNKVWQKSWEGYLDTLQEVAKNNPNDTNAVLAKKYLAISNDTKHSQRAILAKLLKIGSKRATKWTQERLKALAEVIQKELDLGVNMRIAINNASDITGYAPGAIVAQLPTLRQRGFLNYIINRKTFYKGDCLANTKAYKESEKVNTKATKAIKATKATKAIKATKATTSIASAITPNIATKNNLNEAILLKALDIVSQIIKGITQ